MADSPFDIGHLHASEQMRIRAGNLSREERDKLMRGENPWPKFTFSTVNDGEIDHFQIHQEEKRKLDAQLLESLITEKPDGSIDRQLRDQESNTTPEKFLVFHRNPDGTPEVRLHPEPPSAEELALRKREELLKREEELQSRREHDRRMQEMRDDPITNLLDQIALRKREELLEREERLQSERRLEQRKQELDKILDRQPTIPSDAERSAIPTFERIGESAFSEPTVAEKLWKLTESNFFWGGGVGMALTAYAFELGGAPRFAVVLLVMAWLVFTISVFRHGFFERGSKVARLIYHALISLAIAVVLAITWILLHPVTVQPVQVAASSAPTPTPMRTTSASPSSSPSPTPKTSPSPSVSPLVGVSTPMTLSNETRIGLLQCNVSEYDNGYRILLGAVCIAKHQQTGQEFIGTITEPNGFADMNVPYGFYVVTIKAEGYLTRVEAVKVGDQPASVGVVLQKAR